METRSLGASGIQASLVGLGCNNFGMKIDLAASRAVIDTALDVGITCFDTADMYGKGQSEEFLGKVLGPQSQGYRSGHKIRRRRHAGQVRRTLGLPRVYSPLH